jgi:hypothetical protein
MFKQVLMLSAAVAGLALAAAAPAEAAQRGRTVSVQGAGGRGYVAQRSISRAPGAVAASRGLQTNSGAGAATTRGAAWADGSYTGGATHTLNNGVTFGRSVTATRNDDGSASYSATRTRPSGVTASVSGVTRVPQ